MPRQAAQAAARSRKKYLSALYHRLAARRGGKTAAIAVAHTILVIAYHLLKDDTTYQELGPHHFDQIDHERVRCRLVNRLEAMGYKVTVEAGDLTPAA